MANHAKVMTSKTLNPKEVNELVQKINQEKLGGIFTLTYEKDVINGYGNHQWLLQYKNDDYIALQFWISDDVEYGYEKDGKWIEEEKLISEQSCIEFRHGHSLQFMWWVEGVFRENLGKYYNAKMWDDGVGECGNPNPERFETFKSYASYHYIKNGTVDEKSIEKWKEIHFNWQKEDIPKELIEALDLDFKI